MEEEDRISDNPHLSRGKFMLENQINTAEDLIKFWHVFGEYAK